MLAGRRIHFHGRWQSQTIDEFQNACWCIDINYGPAGREDLQNQLGSIAEKYRQYSIAWAVVKDTEFIRGT